MTVEYDGGTEHERIRYGEPADVTAQIEAGALWRVLVLFFRWLIDACVVHA